MWLLYVLLSIDAYYKYNLIGDSDHPRRKRSSSPQKLRTFCQIEKLKIDKTTFQTKKNF